MIKIGLEQVQMALEATRGTPIANPTHLIPITDAGVLTPEQSLYEPEEQRGQWTRHYRTDITREWGAFSYAPVADTGTLPFLLNMLVAPNTTPSTPVGATNARIWEFVLNQTTDNIRTATMWWGDTTLQTFRGAFAVLEQMEFTNDGSGEDGATMTISGHTNPLETVAAPTPATAITNGSLIVPSAMQIWLDTGSDAIGTTEITGQNLFVSATHTLTTGVSSSELKYLAQGPTTNHSYTAISRNASSIRLVTTITVELPNMTNYNLFRANTPVKLRVRHNGRLIESTFYNYAEFDTYGPLENLTWSTHASGNRVASFTVKSQYDATLAGGFRVAIQNARATL